MFRNAPRSGGISPAQLVLNRPVRDSVPAHRRSFAPEWQIVADAIEKRARRSNELQIKNYNKKAHPLPPFTVGNHVLIQHPISKLWKTTGVIVEVGPHRDYLVETLAGRIYRRNRRLLRHRIPTFEFSQPIPEQHPIPICQDQDPAQPQPIPSQEQPDPGQ